VIVEQTSPVIALLTDFGFEDTYLGVMKSVVLTRCPDATFLDVCHLVTPQNVRQAAFLMWTAYQFLPQGTVTVSVIDPGVGTDRKPIAVSWPRGFFVGPDNGWLSYVLRDANGHESEEGATALPAGWKAVHLDVPRFWLTQVSSTFHGRDIFAPVAGSIAAGAAFDELGSPLQSIQTLKPERVQGEDGVVRGRVIHVDHFGNLITDIGAVHLSDRFTVTLGGGTIEGPERSYQSASPLVALIGSNGLLEIAAPNSNASRLIMVGVGEPVTVVTRRKHESVAEPA